MGRVDPWQPSARLARVAASQSGQMLPYCLQGTPRKAGVVRSRAPARLTPQQAGSPGEPPRQPGPRSTLLLSCTPPPPLLYVAIVFRYQRVQGVHRGDSALV